MHMALEKIESNWIKLTVAFVCVWFVCVYV